MLVIRTIQNKTTLKGLFTYQISRNQKSDSTLVVGDERKQSTPIHGWYDCKLTQHLWSCNLIVPIEITNIFAQ